MIRVLLVIQVPDASDKRGVARTFRPIDRFSLRFEGAEHVVRMVFDDIIVDMAPLRAALGARFNVNVRHVLLSLGIERRPGEPTGAAQSGRPDD